MALKSLRIRKLGLPLLVKELVEQAARRRTYIVRVVYAALLFAAFAVFFYGEVARRGRSYELLGVGGRMFTFLMVMQFIGIYVFLPAMVSGVITYEKERRSLELLFITDMSPWEIVLQKLGGRLVPMFTFLLLSLPLMAISYSFGGVSAPQLASGAYVLVVTCFQVGAFAVMISAYNRTSSEAFVATYTYGLVLMVLASIVLGGVAAAVSFGGAGTSAAFVLGLVPPWLLGFARGNPFLSVVGCTAGAWLITLVFLLSARKYLVSRAFLQERKRPKGALERALEGIILRRRRVPGKGRGKSRWPLPGDEPITWREVTRTMVGTPGFFAATAVLAGLAVLAPTLLMLLGRRYSREAAGITFLVTMLWFVAAVAVAGPSAASVSQERANQTLEVLLTTPLTGEEIVRQKAGIARRRTLLFLVLFLILFGVEAWWEGGAMAGRDSWHYDLGPVGYLVTATLSVLIFLPAFAWVAGWIGLAVRKRTRATMLTVGAFLVWCVGPWALFGWMSMSGSGSMSDHVLAYVTLLSPATLIGLTEAAGTDDAFRSLFRTGPLIPIAVGFALHGAIIFAFRRACLRNADRYLGRPVGEVKP